MSDSLPIKLRGFADVRTVQMYLSGFWPIDWIKASKRQLEIKALYYKIRITPDQIIELRFFKRLFPHIVIIAKNNDEHVKVSFRYFREKTLRTVLIDSGFHITKEAIWETMIPLDSENDIYKYNLYKGSD